MSYYSIIEPYVESIMNTVCEDCTDTYTYTMGAVAGFIVLAFLSGSNNAEPEPEEEAEDEKIVAPIPSTPPSTPLYGNSIYPARRSGKYVCLGDMNQCGKCKCK